MGKKVYCYLTAYRPNASDLFSSMSSVVSELQSRGVTPLRQKIEAIVFDTKTDVDVFGMKDPSVSGFFDNLYDQIGACLDNDDFEGLDLILEGVRENMRTLEPVLVLSAIRLTWMDRKRLSSWESLRDEFAVLLESRGENAGSVLIGLYDD